MIVNLWHQYWMGHLGVDNLKLLAKQVLVDGFFINKDAKFEFCENCVLG
jgi:hypothetical protein